ncbi:MAG: toll/interleukin-1 receptor domain-containing protein [Robiginitomaculum sp.]|nr:toll/interleukin-1 receptor domain-containing protein [Robiginitomaculum sp.]
MGNYHYKAFISYSHKDHRWGRWLHRRLESYRIPKHLLEASGGSIGVVEVGGAAVSDFARLKPIFRDREELGAADSLGEKIEQALLASENLIIICSPQAAKSKWVNQEILSFKRQGRGGNIFCVIVEGEPFSGGDNECFPPALRYEIDPEGKLTDSPAEPLASDLRSNGDGKRLGLLKLIAGMLDVKLDDLVQRDMQRNRQRVMAITLGASSIVLAMTTLTGFAVSARKEADARRNDAEGLIEFMLTDLKDKLEPVGRLDALDGVSKKAIDYYNGYPKSTTQCDPAGRLARATQLAASIAQSSGNMTALEKYASAAFEITKTKILKCGTRPVDIYDHAQSSFWKGYDAYLKGNTDIAETYFLAYRDLALELVQKEPNKPEHKIELAYANSNLGSLLYGTGKYEDALKIFEREMVIYTQLIKSDSNFNELIDEYADTFGWIGLSHSRLGNSDLAKNSHKKAISVAEDGLKQTDVNTWELLFVQATSMRNLSSLHFQDGEYIQSLKVGQQSQELLLRLVNHDPNNQSWIIGLAYAQGVLLKTYRGMENRMAFDILHLELQATLAKFPDDSDIPNQKFFQNLSFEKGE